MIRRRLREMQILRIFVILAVMTIIFVYGITLVLNAPTPKQKTSTESIQVPVHAGK